MMEGLKVDLPKALIIGCYFISAVFVLNGLCNISDLFLTMPLLNKVFLYGISIYVFLTITHLIILFKQINVCITEKCAKHGDKKEKDADSYFAFKISPKIITNLNTSTTVLLGVCAGIVLLMVLPTYMAKSKNIRKK